MHLISDIRAYRLQELNTIRKATQMLWLCAAAAGKQNANSGLIERQKTAPMTNLILAGKRKGIDVSHLLLLNLFLHQLAFDGIQRLFPPGTSVN